MNKDARKVTSYFIPNNDVTNGKGELISVPELYLKVLQDLIKGVRHPEYTSLLNQELVSELFRLPSIPVIRNKANGKEIVFNTSLENDYCMPVLRELLTTIIIDKLGFSSDTKGLIEAIKAGESWSSPSAKKNNRDTRTVNDFNELYDSIVNITNPFIHWFFNQYSDNGIVNVTYKQLKNKRKRMVFYYEWESDVDLTVLVNVGSPSAPLSKAILIENEIVEFVDQRYVTKEIHIGSQVDRLIYNELIPQLVFALTENNQMCMKFFNEKPPIQATTKTLLTKKLREDINAQWVFQKLDLSKL